MKNLPEYLQPPIEPFFNTGIDPDKAINPSDIAPNAPTKVQEKLHDEVTEKISKTMGYGKKDVQEALEAEEPSAIKDAYMIVRENKLMQVNRELPYPERRCVHVPALACLRALFCFSRVFLSCQDASLMASNHPRLFGLTFPPLPSVAWRKQSLLPFITSQC